jgi:sarcosine oxidase subunit beta
LEQGHFYISQSDKGEMVMGGDLDGYNSYAQRGNLPTLQHVLTEGNCDDAFFK